MTIEVGDMIKYKGAMEYQLILPSKEGKLVAVNREGEYNTNVPIKYNIEEHWKPIPGSSYYGFFHPKGIWFATFKRSK
jgi:hypothetical protein